MLTVVSFFLLLSIFVLLLDWQVDTRTTKTVERGEELSRLTPPRYRDKQV